MTTDDQPPIPSADPAEEKSDAYDELFAESCLAAVQEYPFAKGWEILAQRMTLNDVWGLVWRADFRGSINDGDPSRNYRVVCWKDNSGKLCVGIAVTDHPLRD